VTAVPAYVVTSTDIDICDGFSCTTALPPHDRMAGNVTAAYALASFRAGGGPGSAAARVYLERLNRRPA
jgi:conjugal transfer pilus assembly protein TrbC